MPLLSFWKNSRSEVLKLSISQVISSAGNGLLKDGTECSKEFRAFLQEVDSEVLFDYANQCLDSFDKSGLVLQDIVNEMGRRLEFDVEHGLYQGKAGAIGYDGIWKVSDIPPVIIEVKTSDFVAVSLDRLANYREKLVEAGKIPKDSSVLIVVGREDSGALEAQVRGSRYAWTMRLISVEGLAKLVQVKEKSDEKATLGQIRQLLKPVEYTKLDRIIDVIFATATDVESQAPDNTAVVLEDDAHGQIRTAPELLDVKRQIALQAFGILKKKALVKKSKALYWSPDRKLRVCCSVSKRYDRDHQPYWYAYHPVWDEFLREGEDSYMLLVCMDRAEAFAIPYSWLSENKSNLNVTQNGQKSYWHIALTTIEGSGLGVNLSKVSGKQPLNKFAFALRE
jgi:hypothetical protein